MFLNQSRMPGQGQRLPKSGSEIPFFLLCTFGIGPLSMEWNSPGEDAFHCFWRLGVAWMCRSDIVTTVAGV